MTQRDRDRLVVLKKAQRKLITQKQAAAELEISERQVRRMLARLKQRGDKAVIHGLRGRRSNRRLPTETRERIVATLSEEVYRDFGPTLASEYLAQKHGIQIGREALRQLMAEAGLWQPKARKLGKKHQRRDRKARFGEMVQWDTSDHDWVEGRGERIYLVHMIDDATSRLLARFVRSDSSEENMRLLWTWLERYGRPLAFYTDKDSMFYASPKRVDGADVPETAPTQIGRALGELQIAGILAHSPQAKGRVERSFQTAQDRLVKGMRVAGVKTIEQANAYLERDFLPWWEKACMVRAAHPDDAHRPLGPDHDLAAALSFVDWRKVCNDHTFRFGGHLYQIAVPDIVPGLRGSRLRIETRLDGTMAVRFEDRYLAFEQCEQSIRPPRVEAPALPKPASPPAAVLDKPGRKWMRGFTLAQAPSWAEIRRSGALDRL